LAATIACRLKLRRYSLLASICYSMFKGVAYPDGRDGMTDLRPRLFTATLIIALASFACLANGQAATSVAPVAASAAPSLEPLLDFRNADIRFPLTSLMSVLRDRNHEGWVLAAYPDPNTGHPLIGAGFSLEVAATDYPQYDPLNPNQFLEPSSAQLWQAAGLDPERLPEILDEFDQNMDVWGTKGYRRKIRLHRLKPQLTEEEATRLLRISAIQAVINAKAYCRNFDRLSEPAQMALSQLAFQMGVNLEEFVEFLSELNGDTSHPDLSPLPDGGVVGDAEHWRNVQKTLIDSQWARRYSVRAATVIAMFDPNYERNPRASEARVMAVLRPPSKHRGHRPAKASSHARHSAG
jgi:hypothetical protein